LEGVADGDRSEYADGGERSAHGSRIALHQFG
jgi:hypothetical protein